MKVLLTKSLLIVSLILCFLSSVIAQSNNNLVNKSISTSGQAILDEINYARANPQKYIAYLEDYKKTFKGKTVYNKDGAMLETNEGTTVVDETINFLKTLPVLAPYQFSKGLNTAAGSQLKDLMENSSIGHRGKDGSTLPVRLTRFGSFGTMTSENITYHAPLPRDIVLTMIIDDGYASRSHRKNIFSPNFKQIGIGFGKNSKGENLCVAIFADSFRDRGAMPTGAKSY